MRRFARVVAVLLALALGLAMVAGTAEAARKPKPKKQTPAVTAPATPGAIASTVPGCMNLTTDMGRPVCEIARDLGVPAEVFREAFTHVTPAAKGAEPSEAQREANHQALLSRLAPYGVTPQLLDQVSDRYRL